MRAISTSPIPKSVFVTLVIFKRHVFSPEGTLSNELLSFLQVFEILSERNTISTILYNILIVYLQVGGSG